MRRSPTLLHTCARAATAAETRFRVDYPNSKPRVSRIVALDAGAAAMMRRAAAGWRAEIQLFEYQGPRITPGLASLPVDARLRAGDGSEAWLSDALSGADLAVMIASSDRGSEAAALIGDACAARGIMSAGLIVAERAAAQRVASALRPHAAVLVVTPDEDYLGEMLTALRA